MSLSIQNNYGQVNHIENSNVSINPNGRVVNEGQLRTNEENPNLNVEDVAFEEVPVYCRYLDIEAIKNAGIWFPAQVQEQLEKASEKDAKEFVAFLRDYERKKYLNFHGEGKRKVFNTLRAELPMMRKYTESNFYTYF